MSKQVFLIPESEIHDHLLRFIDDSNVSIEKLTNFLNNLNLRNNKDELREILGMILNISEYHHRHSLFFDKIKQIFAYLKEDIKSEFVYFDCTNLEAVFFNEFQNKYFVDTLKDETISLYDSHIEDYNELFEDILSAYDFKLVASCMKYIRAYVKNPTEPIQDMFPFIKFSLTHNIDRLSKTEEASTEWRERFDEFFKRFHKSD